MATKAQTDAEKSTIKHVIARGIELDVDMVAMDDYELVDYLAQIDDNALYASKAMRKLLGDEQNEKVINALKNDSGRVTIDSFGEFVKELFEQLDPNS